MKSSGYVLGAIFLAFAVTTALAEPSAIERQANPPSRIVSWDGFYVGANLGGAWSNYRIGNFIDHVDVVEQFTKLFQPDATALLPDFDPVFVNTPETDATDGSFFGGGQLGYNKQWEQLVIGFEGDFDGLSTSHVVSSEFSRTVAPGFFTRAEVHGTATREASTDWNASIRMRIGYTYNRWLFYLTGGPAFAEVNGRADDIAVTDFFRGPFQTGTITSTNSSSSSEVLTGWTAGIGAECWIRQSISIGFEYRYSNFGGDTFEFGSHNSQISSGSTGIDLSSHQLTARVNFLLSSLFEKH